MTDSTLRVMAGEIDHCRDGITREQVLVGLIEPTREEPGCIGYELLENLEDPRELTFVEEWQGESALEAHFSTDHIANALQEFPGLLAQELDLRKYRLLG